jgi:hypothetical protein
VSLTSGSEGKTEIFADSFEVPWPCGYGAELSTIGEFGAYQPDRPGYEVLPTIYLADGSGRVLWHDEQARPRHRKDADAIVTELNAAIERALAENSDGGEGP